MTQVLIAIGSNINKDVNIGCVLKELALQEELTLLNQSRIYETVAIGSDGRPTMQPSFYNLAVQVETDLNASLLRNLLRLVEEKLGRKRTSDKFAPRPIDLDIIYFGAEPVVINDICYPDPELSDFPHLVCPLAEIAPHWLVPEPNSGIQSGPLLTLEMRALQLLESDDGAAQILRIIE